MGEPSDKAVDAAYGVLTRAGEVGPTGGQVWRALKAAHDPALGLDRSVRLRDVVEALRADIRWDPDGCKEKAIDFIEREFGGTDGR